MSSVLRSTKEATSLRRQFTVYPYYAQGTNQFFTVANNTLYRFQHDLSGVDYVVARDMGTEVAITAIDPNIVNLLTYNADPPSVQFIRNGTARKFQVLSMVAGNNYTGAGNSTAYGSSNGIYDYTGEELSINNALVVGGANTTSTTPTSQSLPFGTFWAVNDPIIIRYDFSDAVVQRAIKNRIDETTHF